MAYYKTKASVREYIQMSKDVSGADLIVKLKAHLSAKARLLELGSGPGTDWNLLSKDYTVVGSDYSKEFLSHLRASYPMGQFLELDATTLATTEQFEGIYSNKVLHHLTDEELISSLNRQFEIISPQGIICHSFWKGEGSEVFKGMFVNYHTEQALRDILAPNFEVLLLEPYEEFEPGDSLLLIARKK